MATPLDIPSLTVGTRVEDTLIVRDVDVRTQANGDPFTILTLGNGTGTIATEPFWSERGAEVAGLRRGHVVRVVGDVAVYRDRPQLRIITLRHVPADAADLSTLLPSVGPVDRFWNVLDGWRREIGKPRLRAVIDLFYEEDLFRRRYEQCPGAVIGHHAVLGGLLKHTVEVAAIARTIAKVSGADVELVVAGALLHDIGKLEAYRWEGTFEQTERGRLLGHVTLGAMLLDRRLAEQSPPPCTDLERDILLHLILAHHGRLEFGSPITPMTLEAEVLHWADNASAKTESVADVLRDNANFAESLVSSSQRMLDHRRFWRGTSDWGNTSPNSQ
jgi:3'-5' exoribonuclease